MATKKMDLSSLSARELLEEVAAELARRRAAGEPAEDMSAMELALEAEAEALKRASLGRRLERCGNEEDDSAKGCLLPRAPADWPPTPHRERPQRGHPAVHLHGFSHDVPAASP